MYKQFMLYQYERDENLYRIMISGLIAIASLTS